VIIQERGGGWKGGWEHCLREAVILNIYIKGGRLIFLEEIGKLFKQHDGVRIQGIKNKKVHSELGRSFSFYMDPC